MATKLISGIPQLAPNTPAVHEIQLTPDEDLVACFVARSPNCSRHEIACELNLSPTRCEVAIRGLEKKGLIERKEDWS